MGLTVERSATNAQAQGLVELVTATECCGIAALVLDALSWGWGSLSALDDEGRGTGHEGEGEAGEDGGELHFEVLVAELVVVHGR